MSTPEFRRAVRGYDPDEVDRSRSIARDTEDLVNSMVSDAESHMSDLRRQQTMLEVYVQKMRRAATEVDLEITSLQPPSLEDMKPISPSETGAEEEVLEAVEVLADEKAQ